MTLVPALPVIAEPRVRFADLRVFDDDERRALLAATQTVLEHGRLINGPEVAILEKRLAKRAGRNYAVGLGSGSEALALALRALDIGPGAEVITSAVSWVATANAIHLVGATPVFADVDEGYNIDPASVRRVISPRTKAIMGVHYAGRPYDAATIDLIAAEYRLHHLEDGSQAFGGAGFGRPVGGAGRIACCSANPMKLLAATGEAGFALCDDVELYDRLLRLRYNGVLPGDLLCREPASNARLDTLQAAMLLVRLDRLDEAIACRKQLARRYMERLGDVARFPPPFDGVNAYFLFPIRIMAMERDRLVAHLNANGVEARSRATDFLPLHPPFHNCRGEWRRAEALIAETLFTPIHGRMTPADVDLVANLIIDFIKGR